MLSVQVFRWINGKDPRQYGFDFGLWTRKIVQALIWDKFGLELGGTAVGRLLAELEIRPQKPLRRAYERDPKAIARWMMQDYPRLRALLLPCSECSLCYGLSSKRPMPARSVRVRTLCYFRGGHTCSRRQP